MDKLQDREFHFENIREFPAIVMCYSRKFLKFWREFRELTHTHTNKNNGGELTTDR